MSKEGKETIDPNEPLNIQCHERHIFEMSFNDFEAGYRCPICKFLNENPGWQVLDSYIEELYGEE